MPCVLEVTSFPFTIHCCSLQDPSVSSHVVQPLPVYRTGLASDKLTELYDICYHLLQLYCDRSYDLGQLVNPATFTPCVLDYRLV